MMKVEVEYRYLRELRTRGKLGLSGYAAIFNKPAQLKNFREECGKTCFDRALEERQDVRYLVAHDPNQLLARVSNGTLRLSKDSKGLAVNVDLQDTAEARDHHTNVKSGLLNSMSFGFMVAPDGQRWTEERDSKTGVYFAKRQLTDIKLLTDVSSVCFPAYDGTSISARSAGIPVELRNHLAFLNGEQRDDESEEDEDEDDMDLFGPEYKEDLADNHTEGDCENADCSCQNNMCMPGRRRSMQRDVEKRGRPVRTKRVGGKNLPASMFSRVGDPDKTETWRGATIHIDARNERLWSEARCWQHRQNLMTSVIS
jgi:HK97 family phage prohead protease